MMVLQALTKEQCETVRQWRNRTLESLRTPYMLTQEQQAKFYEDVVCNRNARARFWAVGCECLDECENEHFTMAGMIGLENIEWENGRAEISIMISPELRGNGMGEKALHMLLEQGFMFMGLNSIYGECYQCNKAITFWRKMAAKYNAVVAYIPETKLWNGLYYGSMHFTFDKEAFSKCQE